MNKIGIFGDSFAKRGLTIEKWGRRNCINNNKDWMALLGADTYGYGGTDVAWSFLQFEKHHN